MNDDDFNNPESTNTATKETITSEMSPEPSNLYGMSQKEPWKATLGVSVQPLVLLILSGFGESS